MQVRRINIDSLIQRQFHAVVGLPSIDNEAYALSVIIAGLVRQLLGNKHGSSTLVVSANAIKEVVERGAWLEIAEDGENLVLRTTLK